MNITKFFTTPDDLNIRLRPEINQGRGFPRVRRGRARRYKEIYMGAY
jgi:hypothetical protein